MRLTEFTQKIKELPDLPKDLFVLLVIFLVGAGAYGLGRIAVLEEKRNNNLQIIQTSRTFFDENVANVGTTIQDGGTSDPVPIASNKNIVPMTIGSDKMYVGSRSGKTYHLPWCSGAKRIREENKIWFSSKENAEARGYRPAANCKGI